MNFNPFKNKPSLRMKLWKLVSGYIVDWSAEKIAEGDGIKGLVKKPIK